MIISKLTRLTGILLVAGFFYSCGSTKTNIDNLLSENKYDQAITEIDKRLAEDPAQPSLYIQRAKINAALAKDSDPEVRADFYTSAANDFASAIEYQANNTQLSQIDSLRQQYWKFEHNAGLQVSDNEAITDRYQRAKIHFQNAVIIRHDAVSSYKNLAITEFNLGEIDAAIQSLQNGLEFTDEEQAKEMYEYLGYLHLEKGEPDKAANFYEQANADIMDDRNLAFGLINAYIANGNYEKAADILDALVAENPDNANLRNVYGTQLYEITANIMNDLQDAYTANDSVLVEQILFEAEGMGDEAENQLIEAFRRDTSNTDYIESLAVFYNNLSAKYLSLIPVAFEKDHKRLNDKANMLINFAIDYYEKLAEVDPNNSTYNTRLEILRNLKERRNSPSAN
ncbi:tetratricopeptide repeat protein [Gracilimonas tropica]|uniref:tetratricopeptide repeat protein n=1 Tax=Gracilimonas tropica TaxID=454600 RepID=UPI0014616CE5|nr:tetratricopeptide repeat protein [Gracilimonas tropica]